MAVKANLTTEAAGSAAFIRSGSDGEPDGASGLQPVGRNGLPFAGETPAFRKGGVSAEDAVIAGVVAPANSQLKAVSMFRAKLSMLTPNDFNIREDLGDINRLALSLRAVGQQQPILCYRAEAGQLVVIDGHRRYHAFRLIAEQDETDPDVLIALDTAKLSREQRSLRNFAIMFGTGNGTKPLTQFESAKAVAEVYRIMVNENGGEEWGVAGKVAEFIGISYTSVSSYLTFWREGHSELKALVRQGVVNMTDAVMIIKKTASENDQKNVVEALKEMKTETGAKKLSSSDVKSAAERSASLKMGTPSKKEMAFRLSGIRDWASRNHREVDPEMFELLEALILFVSGKTTEEHVLHALRREDCTPFHEAIIAEEEAGRRPAKRAGVPVPGGTENTPEADGWQHP